MLPLLKSTRNIFLLVMPCLMLSSCDTIDLYEKTVPVEQHAWSSSFKPEFRFTIKDTTVPYRVFITLRHSDRYNYNNIWVNLITQPPGDSAQRIQYELPLASRQGWLGSGMGDVYDHRIAITPPEQDLYFRRSGEYVFKLEQVMREDPLQHVLNVGLRLEKKPQ
ncbi:MAG: gliding motility lipoprotein GldH [Flavisolibacter sp.]|jgi:gliding motility-associated lipoprotein GldH|nr:gliding motility lipoprotein GldH [Flavisolibacter sp.]